jgi:hypothetical protein
MFAGYNGSSSKSMAKRDALKGWLEHTVPLPTAACIPERSTAALQASASASDMPRCVEVIWMPPLTGDLCIHV